MTIETVERATWPSPRLRTIASFDYRYRPETTDWNTVNSIFGDANNADEYGIAGLTLSGWAVDVGAHIGGMSIALALDNPDLRVIAIEPVPANVELLRRNVELNGLSDRITILNAAAGIAGECTINWNWRDNASDGLAGHRYIGGSSLALSEPTATHDETVVTSYSLASLLKAFDIDEIALLKIDCEGCEATFLKSTAVKHIARIVGEFHPPYIDRPGIVKLLKTHDVEFTGPEAGPGGFTAVRR